MRYLAVVAYNGSGYHGFQIQSVVPTVEKALNQSLSFLTKQPMSIRGASRTDQGVHAKGQVIAFDLEGDFEIEQFLLAWNRVLPPDIRIRTIKPTNNEFHPRFDATEKTYQYQVSCQPLDEFNYFRFGEYPQLAGYNITEFFPYLAVFLGTHDFYGYGITLPNQPTIRTIKKFSVKKTRMGFCFTITGSGFLRYMVRKLVGSVIQAVLQQLPVESLTYELDQHERKAKAKRAPAGGLTLVKIKYPVAKTRL
jgi:tRNA pseudouridine38-40 synthase